MKVNRRGFLKGAAASGLVLASNAQPSIASRKKPRLVDALGILYDATLCIGCQACMVSCKNANNMPYEHTGDQKLWDNPSDLSSKTLNIIKKYVHGTGEVKDRAENGFSFIKRQCMHCVDPACVFSCPVSAMIKDPKNGVVSWDKDACIGCRYCQIACPFNIPKFEWDSPFPKIVKCELCRDQIEDGGISACCSACPTGASLFGPVYELLKEAKRRREMKPGKFYEFPVSSISSNEIQVHRAGQYIPNTYGENEVGGTQVLMLAGVPFDKLGLPVLPDRSFVSMADGIQYAIYKGMVYPLIVLGGLIYMVGNQNKED